MPGEAADWTLIFCLRIAVLLHRSRESMAPPVARAAFTSRGFSLSFSEKALAETPLTAAVLAEEALQWASVGGELILRH